MDKSCHSSGDSSASSVTHTNANASSISSTTIPSNDKDQFLRHLNKLSHKISKPSTSITRPPVNLRPPPPPAPPLQHQPPVYNINKSDFRDVVQKLTGSPSHAPPPPPPIHAPKPASSRLQRIRPPPLAQLSNRPPPLLNCAQANPSAGGGFIRQVAPLSPLPPLPTCHAAAESPISAYMRFLRTTSAVDSDPRLSNRTAPMNPPLDSFSLPPKSPCQPLSPNLLLSPTGGGPLGFPQLPASPTVSGVPSPKWRDL